MMMIVIVMIINIITMLPFFTKVGVKELMRVYELLGEHYTEVFTIRIGIAMTEETEHM